MVSAMIKGPDRMPEPPQSDELFVTFANTLEFTRGLPTDHVEEPSALLAWLKENGLLNERGRAMEAQRLRRDPAEAQRRLERFRYLRDLVHTIAERVNEGTGPPASRSVTSTTSSAMACTTTSSSPMPRETGIP